MEGNLLATLWYIRNTNAINKEFTRIAKNIPKALEYHNHQVVIEFHTKKARYDVASVFSPFLLVSERRMFFSAIKSGMNPKKAKRGSPYVGQAKASSKPEKIASR